MRFIWLCCIIFLLPWQAYAATEFRAGFKTLGLWDKETSTRLDLAIWYPTLSSARNINQGAWNFAAAPNAKSAQGRFPLLLLSHDTAGARFSYYNTAINLAQSGFVVVAPTHSQDNMNHMPKLYTLEQITKRAEELRFTLDAVLENKNIKDSIDKNRIGILGFGLGATAALLLGGASLDQDGWTNFCAQTGNQSPYCYTWSRERMQRMAEQLPLTQNYTDPRIQAIAAVAPTYSMLFTSKALATFKPAILLVQAKKDTLNPDPWNTITMYGEFATQPEFFSVPEVDSLDFMAACPPALIEDLPDLCGTASQEVRQEAHAFFLQNMRAFFIKNIGQLGQ